MSRNKALFSLSGIFGLRQLLLLFSVVIFASNGHATPCLYKGVNADARVINRSGEITAPFPTALSAHDCRRLRVATESVTVWIVNSAASAPTTSLVTMGPLVPSSDLAAPIGSDTLGILKQIVVVLEGINRTKTGSSRGGVEEYLVSGLPSGKLAEPSADLILELGLVPDRNLVAFELIQGVKVKHRQTGPAKTLMLPQSALKAGNEMRWKLEYAGKKFEGQFTVESGDRLSEIKRSMQSEATDQLDSISDALRLASALALENYGWDSRVVIRGALADSQILK